MNQKWEVLHPEKVQEFKTCYADDSLSLKLIAANFDLSHSSIHDVARRLGIPLRPIRSSPIRPKLGAPVILCQLDDEIVETQKKLEALEQKKMSLMTRAERQGDSITIYGLSEPITRSVEDLTLWLKYGGPAKIRQLIREDEW